MRERSLHGKLKLQDSRLTKEQKVNVYDIKEECHDVFILSGEIGICPHVEVHLKLHDETEICFPLCSKGGSKTGYRKRMKHPES